jgi:hypothetical protein
MSHVLHQSIQQLQAAGNFRDAYLTYIHHILVVAATKFTHRQTKNSERIAWGRLMLHAIKTGQTLLNARELEALDQRLQHLEDRITS